MIYILAGDGKQADDYLKTAAVGQGNYVIVHENGMRGRHFDAKKDKLVTVGTWRKRADLESVRFEAAAVGLDIPE